MPKIKLRKCRYCTKNICPFKADGQKMQAGNYIRLMHCGGDGCVKKHKAKKRLLTEEKRAKVLKRFNSEIKHGTTSFINGIRYRFGSNALGGNKHNFYFRECGDGSWIKTDSVDRMDFCEGMVV